MHARNGIPVLVSALAVMLTAAPSHAQGQNPPTPTAAEPTMTFRSSVNLVSVAAVVRDKRGRVMPSLSGKDFEVIDGGQRKELVDFQSTTTAPASVALLIDGSGSMRLGSAQESARQISRDILRTLDSSRDTAALY